MLGMSICTLRVLWSVCVPSPGSNTSDDDDDSWSTLYALAVPFLLKINRFSRTKWTFPRPLMFMYRMIFSAGIHCQHNSVAMDGPSCNAQPSSSSTTIHNVGSYYFHFNIFYLFHTCSYLSHPSYTCTPFAGPSFPIVSANNAMAW